MIVYRPLILIKFYRKSLPNEIFVSGKEKPRRESTPIARVAGAYS